MNIVVLHLPANTAYGFDGVTPEEFETYQERIDYVLGFTCLEYECEELEGTDCATSLWSTNSDYVRKYMGSWEFDPNDPNDTICDISEQFHSEIICKYNFWEDLSDETVLKIVKDIREIVLKASGDKGICDQIKDENVDQGSTYEQEALERVRTLMTKHPEIF